MFEIKQENGEIKIGLQKWEEEMLRIKKIRKNTKCYMCKSKIPKGSWAYGERYTKICIKCEKATFFPKMIDSINKLNEKVKEQSEDLDLNWEKYERDNTLANLQYGE